MQKEAGRAGNEDTAVTVETLRPVFQAVADGYHTYHDSTWRIDEAEPLETADTGRSLPWVE